MLAITSYVRERHLMRAKCPFNRETIDLSRASPSFRSSQNDGWPLRVRLWPVFARLGLNAAYPRVALIKRSRERPMHIFRVSAFDNERLIATRLQQRAHVIIRRTGEGGWTCNFVSI